MEKKRKKKKKKKKKKHKNKKKKKKKKKDKKDKKTKKTYNPRPKKKTSRTSTAGPHPQIDGRRRDNPARQEHTFPTSHKPTSFSTALNPSTFSLRRQQRIRESPHTNQLQRALIIPSRIYIPLPQHGLPPSNSSFSLTSLYIKNPYILTYLSLNLPFHYPSTPAPYQDLRTATASFSLCRTAVSTHFVPRSERTRMLSISRIPLALELFRVYFPPQGDELTNILT